MKISDTLRALAGMESQSNNDELTAKAETLIEELVEKKVEAELKEIEDKIEDLQESVEEHEETIEDLEECVEGMEMLIKSGTNSLALTLLYNRADKLHVKLGNETTLPRAGVESLDERKIHAFAVVGNESFTDSIKNGAKTVGDFLKRIWGYVLEFIKKHFSENGRLLKDAEACKKKLQANCELKDSVPAGNWAPFIKYTEHGGAFRQHMGICVDVVGMLNNGTAVQTRKIAGVIKSYLEGVRNEVDSKNCRHINGVYTMEVDEGATIVYMSTQLRTDEDYVKFFNALEFKFKGIKEVDGVVLESPRRENLIKTCDVVAANIKNFQEMEKKVDAQTKDLEKTLDGITKEEARLIRAMNSAVTRMTMSSLKMTIRASKCMMQMVNACIK